MNVIKLLKKENRIQSYQIETDDYVLIRDIIMQKMSVFQVNSYDSLIIKRDLIGMAQEMKLRGTTLKQELGNDLDDFIENIIQNSRGPSYLEIILSIIKTLSIIFVMWTAFFSWIYQAWQWPSSVSLPITLIAFVVFIYLMDGLFKPIFILEKGLRKIISNIIAFCIYFLVFYFMPKLNFFSSITMHADYVLIISLIIYGISFISYKKHISNLAKDSRNLVQDLFD